MATAIDSTSAASIFTFITQSSIFGGQILPRNCQSDTCLALRCYNPACLRVPAGPRSGAKCPCEPAAAPRGTTCRGCADGRVRAGLAEPQCGAIGRAVMSSTAYVHQYTLSAALALALLNVGFQLRGGFLRVEAVLWLVAIGSLLLVGIDLRGRLLRSALTELAALPATTHAFVMSRERRFARNNDLLVFRAPFSMMSPVGSVSELPQTLPPGDDLIILMPEMASEAAAVEARYPSLTKTTLPRVRSELITLYRIR